MEQKYYDALPAEIADGLDTMEPAPEVQPKARLTRDTAIKIRKSNPFTTEDVFVPGSGWDTWVTVKALTAAERDNFEKSLVVKKGRKRDSDTANIRAKLVVRTVIDKDTQERIWTDEDARWLGDKAAAPMDVIYTVAAKLCGMSERDEDELENLQSAASGS